MPTAWWLRAPELLVECGRRTPALPESLWYRFADGWLALNSQDDALSRRFQEIYPEGVEACGANDSRRRVLCDVRVHADAPFAAVVFDDPAPLDSFAFCQTLFPDRGYVEGPAGPDGWRTIASRQHPDEPQIALCENFALVDRRQVWQPFVANYAVNRVLRLQRELLFFHAASIGIAGRGAMIVGPKASGKTTTSMTLAARGCDFFGDEMAAINHTTKVMFPFRRAVSIRTGPRARRVEEHLAQRPYPVEKFPDGGERTLVNVGDLFPEAGAAPATLACVLFLRQFAERPKVESFSFGMEHFRMLSPLACSMWGVPAGVRMMDLSRLLRGVQCYFLDPGQPEETADLVETIVSGRYLN